MAVHQSTIFHPAAERCLTLGFAVALLLIWIVVLLGMALHLWRVLMVSHPHLKSVGFQEPVGLPTPEGVDPRTTSHAYIVAQYFDVVGGVIVGIVSITTVLQSVLTAREPHAFEAWEMRALTVAFRPFFP